VTVIYHEKTNLELFCLNVNSNSRFKMNRQNLGGWVTWP